MVNALDVVVGRQGIYDESGVVGYELLFRPGVRDHVGGRPSGGQMTAAVIYGALSMGVDSVVGDKLLFCNADREILTGSLPLLLPVEQTVLEVVETVRVDDEVERGVAALAADGYRIALDAFTTSAPHARLLPHASIVKVDLLLTPPDELAAVIALCADSGVDLLAEKVEDQSAIPELRALGFRLFQGYGLERPTVVSSQTLPAGDVNRLRTVVDVLNSDEDLDSYEKILRRDPGLAHQVMRLASAGRLGENKRAVSSLRDALVIAGSQAVRRWLMLLMARPGKESVNETAMLTVLLRARACELLATHLDRKAADLAFAAGMLSALDELMAASPREITRHLALSPELEDAAFGGEGRLGLLVQDVAEYRYRVSGVRDGVPDLRCALSGDQFDEAFASAFAWAHDTLSAVA